MSKLLTKDEVVEITGARIKANQIKVLLKNKIPFIERVDGWPSVTWAAVNGSIEKENIQVNTEQPNFKW